MNRSLKTLARRMPHPPRRALMRLLAVTGAVALVFSGTPPETTGAWFARQQTVAGNTLASSQLQPLLTVNATSTSAGNNISWNSALTQQWANSNNVKSDVSYTLSRTNQDGSKSNLYTGADTSFFEPGPAPNKRVANAGLVGAGCQFSAFVGADGGVYAWGDNSRAQLGQGDHTTHSGVVKVSGLQNIVSIATGCQTALAIDSSGQVWQWGLGRENGDDYVTPQKVTISSAIKSVSVGFWANSLPYGYGQATFLAVGVDGSMWGWNGSTGPSQFPNVPLMKSVSAGRGHMLALDVNGNVWGWGYSAYGAIGPVATVNSPKQISGIDNVQSISAGFDYSLAIKNDGTGWAWGGNGHGELGIGSNSDTSIPTQIATVSNLTSITASLVYGSMATDSSGRIWSWGIYSDQPGSRFGDNVPGTTTPQVRQSMPANMLQVSASGYGPPNSGKSDQVGGWRSNSVGVQSDGTIWNTDWFTSGTPVTAQLGATTSTMYCPDNSAATEPTCRISGTVTYSVSYTYKNWSSSPRTAVTASTASLVSSGVVLGPNNKCLDIKGNLNVAGTAVDYFDCNGVSGQKWTAWSDGTLRSNGLCLDIAGNGSTHGALVEVWICTGGGGQVWVSRGDGTLFNPRSGNCLDDPKNAGISAVQLQIWDCLQPIPTGQKWTFVSSSNVGPLIGTSGKCVDTYSNTAKDGNPIDIYTCDSTAVGQQWFKLPDGTLRAYNKCMSVVNDAIAPRSLIELRTCTPGSRGQQWAQQADLSWKNPASGLCLDNPAGNTTNLTQFQLWDCNGYSTQKWPTIGTGNPVLGPGSAGKCLDVAGNNNTNGNAVQLWDCNGAAGQNWSLAADGTVRAFNKCLSIYQDGRKPESKVILFDCNGGVGQQWVRLPNASLRNPTTGLCLDDPAGNTANGTQLQIYDCNGFDTQRWTFI